jgi:hypothetical protein
MDATQVRHPRGDRGFIDDESVRSTLCPGLVPRQRKLRLNSILLEHALPVPGLTAGGSYLDLAVGIAFLSTLDSSCGGSAVIITGSL